MTEGSSASKRDIARTKDEIDVERHFLGTTVCLTDGTEGLVFSRNPKNETGYFLYNCHLCGVANLPGERCLQTHIAGKKHQSRLSQPVVDARSFRTPLIQKTQLQMNIAPGEPVPPGFENEVKPMPEIQGFLNKYKEHAIIGAEYCLELITRDVREPGYICLLCDKRGDPRTIVTHWTSYNHRFKYLEKHYPTIIKELVPYRYNPEARNVMPRLIQTVVEAIEDHHGRLNPTVVDNNEFKRNRNKILQDINSDKHFDEKNGPNFVNVVDKKMIDNLIKGSKAIPINIDATKKHESTSSAAKTSAKRIKSDVRKDRDSLDSISSDSDASLTHSSSSRLNKNKRKKSQSPAYRIISRVKRSPPFEEEPKNDKKLTLPTPRELSIQASEITQERYKWEKYRCLVEIAVKELEKTLKDHEKSPEKHPLYPEEWKKFWNRRYKELQAEKKDPNKYDFKPEWIIFWTKRMRELYDEEVEKKKIEIKKKLGFAENAEEKTDQLKQQYKIKAPVKNDKPLAVIDISDDDESISSRRSRQFRRHSRTRSRSRSRSLSSFSDDYDRNNHERNRSRDIEREREREHERGRSPRESYYSKEREIIHHRERYIPIPPPPAEYYRHPHPRSYYPVSHAPHYSYRTMNPYEIPQYKPKSTPVIEEDDSNDDGPLTVVAVLRLLTALEDLLGSLGPKIVDLLAKALALEKVKANSSDEMLLNEDNCVFFETVKEKLKGQLIADVLDSHKVKAVKKAIKNIAAIIHQVNNKATEKSTTDTTKDNDDKQSKSNLSQKDISFDRQLVASKLAAALVLQEKTDVSSEDLDKLIHVFILMVKESKERNNVFEVKDILIELGIIEPEIEKQEFDQTESNTSTQQAVDKEFPLDILEPNDDEDDVPTQNTSGALESLTDSDLQTLLQNFKHLSSEEQHHLIAHLKKLESTDPVRVEKLRRFVDLSDFKKDKENSPLKESTKEIKNSKNISIYSDEEDDIKLQKMIDSEDDDDYNFDEVVKAASNNVKDTKHHEDHERANSLSREPDAEISNMSKASSSSNTTANLNASLADTQNLIANIMGSLQKNSQSFNPTSTATTSNNGNIIPTVVNRQHNNRDNMPFYLQSQQKQQPNQQIQNKPNQMFPTVNTNFQNNSFFNQQSNYNPNMFGAIQSQNTQPSHSQITPNIMGSNLPFDLKQLQPNQVQQMINSLLAQQNKGQMPQQHNFQQRGSNPGDFF